VAITGAYVELADALSGAGRSSSAECEAAHRQCSGRLRRHHRRHPDARSAYTEDVRAETDITNVGSSPVVALSWRFRHGRGRAPFDRTEPNALLDPPAVGARRSALYSSHGAAVEKCPDDRCARSPGPSPPIMRNARPELRRILARSSKASIRGLRGTVAERILATSFEANALIKARKQLPSLSASGGDADRPGIAVARSEGVPASTRRAICGHLTTCADNVRLLKTNLCTERMIAVPSSRRWPCKGSADGRERAVGARSLGWIRTCPEPVRLEAASAA
jgi:hypothetical protein